MAIVTLRFRFVGPTTQEVDDLIAGAATRTDLIVSGAPLSEWTFDDAVTDPVDVTVALEEAGWEQVADDTPPVTPAVLVYRPGATPAGNVYDDWSALFAAYELTDGPVTIEFDDSIVSPAVVPAGTYAFRQDTTLEGILRQNPTLGGEVGSAVDLADGVVFDPPPLYFRNGLFLRSLSSAPIISIAPTGGPVLFEVLLLERGTTFQALGSAPFVECTRLSTEGGVFFFLVLGGRLSGGATPCLNMVGDVGGGTPAVAQMNLLSSATVETDAIAGNALGFVFADLSDNSEFSLSQVGYTASLPLRESLTVRGRRFLPTEIVDAVSVGSIAIRANMTVRCDPLIAGPMAVPLPPIGAVQPGDEILIKNVTASPNTITVSPSGADTIDGAPSLGLSSPRGVVKLQSDGVSDWMVVVA